MNFEIVVIDEMIDIVFEVKFVYVCLVFEKCEEFIIEGGFDVVGNFEKVKVVIEKLIVVGIKVLLFIDVDNV